MTLLTENLYERVLVDPALKGGADTLYVVSGYASPSVVFQQMEDIKNKIGKTLTVCLIVGMVGADGIVKPAHEGFKKLVSQDFKHNLSCSYITGKPSVHTKLYIWSKDGKPCLAYAGSANYTSTGFGKTNRKQKEILTECNAEEGLSYFNELLKVAMPCSDPEAEQFFKDRIYTTAPKSITSKNPIAAKPAATEPTGFTAEDMITLSFLSKKLGNTVPERSSLNWGQRPEEGREPNQAYIPIPSTIYGTDFFPPIGVYFNIQADDGEVFIATRAQENGKAIHTPYNNSLFGLYFRERLDVPLGEMVTREQLEIYGRTDVTFTKIDEENYEMDFSVSKK